MTTLMVIALVALLYLIITFFLAIDPLIEWSILHQEEDARRVFAAFLWPVILPMRIATGTKKLFADANLEGLWDEVRRQGTGKE